MTQLLTTYPSTLRHYLELYDEDRRISLQYPAQASNCMILINYTNKITATICSNQIGNVNNCSPNQTILTKTSQCGLASRLIKHTLHNYEHIH